MYTYLFLLIILAIINLIIVSAMRPLHSDLSIFELERRAETGDRQAKRALSREKLFNSIIFIKNLTTDLLIVIIALLNIINYGWLTGSVVILFVIFGYRIIANFQFVRNLSQRLYKLIENRLYKFIRKYSYFFNLMSGNLAKDAECTRQIGSSDELYHIISNSDNILTHKQKKLIVNGMSFGSHTVKTIMTPSNRIKSINKSEFLGPLTLDELHKTGHSVMPVVNNDINHIVGIIYLNSLLNLDVKRSVTAEKAMDTDVGYIRQDKTLLQALAVFLRTHHHLLVVINNSRQTVGILTLGDIIGSLFGYKITEEVDE